MNRKDRATRRAVSRLSLAALVFFGVFGPMMFPSVAVDAPLRIAVFALAGLGVSAMVSAGREMRLAGQNHSGDRERLTPLIFGGLLGAAFVSPLAAVPWLVLPAMAIAWAGRGSVRRRRPPGSGAAAAVLSALTLCTLVAATSSQGLRVSREEFSNKDFPVNSLLADVPLHDVWAIELEGHPSPTLDDLTVAFRHGSPLQATPALVGFSMLRGVLGVALGWEDPEWSTEEVSFIHRLADAQWRRSTTKPGTTLGIWRVLYAFPGEGAVETINGTAHVAVAASIGTSGEGQRLFLSFRVREVNWTTRFYMRVIDPFRRFFVYPTLLKQFAHSWERGVWNGRDQLSNGDQR